MILFMTYLKGKVLIAVAKKSRFLKMIFELFLMVTAKSVFLPRTYSKKESYLKEENLSTAGTYCGLLISAGYG